MGKLVMIPTMHKAVKDRPSMVASFTVIAIKGIKRLLEAHKKDTGQNSEPKIVKPLSYFNFDVPEFGILRFLYSQEGGFDNREYM